MLPPCLPESPLVLFPDWARSYALFQELASGLEWRQVRELVLGTAGTLLSLEAKATALHLLQMKVSALVVSLQLRGSVTATKLQLQEKEPASSPGTKLMVQAPVA